MSKLLKIPLRCYSPLLEVKAGTIVSVNFQSTKFKSKPAGKEEKKEKASGPAKSDKDKLQKDEKGKKTSGPVKGSKDDKASKAVKGGKGDSGEKSDSDGEKKGKGCAHKSSEDGSPDKGSSGKSSSKLSKFARIGINGFGRIGRTALRIAEEYNCPLEIVAVNDVNMEPDYMAYLLKYDSIHGPFPNPEVDYEGDQLLVGDKRICTYRESEAQNVPWKDLGVDYVIESSGKYTTAEKCQAHIDAGAKHVVVSAPCKDDSPTFVVGVNLFEYDPSMKVVSGASCATNALAPLAKVINDNFEIIEGFMTTVHAVTASQKILDQHSKKNWRESRSGIVNMIPTYTGAAVAVAKVLPELKGKMTALSIRVPIPNVSMIDFVFRTKKATSLDEITKKMEEAADDELLGVINVTHDLVVSADFVSSHYSSIYDAKSCMELNPNFFKIVAWFDNEYGYTCRVIDLIKFMHQEAKEAEDGSDD